MQLTSLIAAAGLAASTGALLLPPEISASDNDIISTLPIPAETDVEFPNIADTQSLDLKCPGCVVSVGKDDTAFTNTIPSHLKLDFTIEAAEGTDRLLLNGFELYPSPHPEDVGGLSARVQADIPNRRPTHFKGMPNTGKVQSLGYGLQTQSVPTTEDDALELVMVELQIIQVGMVFADGIPNVQVKLVKTPSGKLMIGAIDTMDSQTLQKSPMDKQEECTTMLCKWKAIIMQKIAQLRAMQGCGGRTGHMSAGMRKPAHQGQRPYHHEQHNNRMGHLFRNIVYHILLPVAVGVVVGVTASILGMMVGTFIVFLWRTFVRRDSCQRRNKYAHGRCHKAAQHDAAVDDEKSGLMAYHEDADIPPAYVESGIVASDEKRPESEA
ncbi:hypothetical protein F5Y15DRAFT_161207 [Xylariaceae sp. FL0016]|nr:hypothetical protein F5Y15DRAFT_161207 [Xylariaceae sp. FL0016]